MKQDKKITCSICNNLIDIDLDGNKTCVGCGWFEGMKKKITVPLSEEDLEELRRGKVFNWEFEGVEVKILVQEEEW